MQLFCPNCHTLIPGVNINVHTMIAVCHRCDHVFAFDRPPSVRKPKSRKLKAPGGLHAQVEADALTLSYRLVNAPEPILTVIQAVLGALVWGFVLVGWLQGGIPLGILLGISALAMVFTYVMVALAALTTEISADSMGITVSQGPFPLPGQHQCHVEAANVIDILYRKTDEDSPHWMPVFNVVAEMRNGKHMSIVPHLRRDMARYIANSLDDFVNTVEVEADVYVLGSSAASGEVFGADDGELDPAFEAAMVDQVRRARTEG